MEKQRAAQINDKASWHSSQFEVWLAHDRNTSKTAEALGVMRNTVANWRDKEQWEARADIQVAERAEAGAKRAVQLAEQYDSKEAVAKARTHLKLYSGVVGNLLHRLLLEVNALNDPASGTKRKVDQQVFAMASRGLETEARCVTALFGGPAISLNLTTKSPVEQLLGEIAEAREEYLQLMQPPEQESA